MTNRLTSLPPRAPTEPDPEPVGGPAAGLCARCVHGVVTVFRCGGEEAWQDARLASVAACHSPFTALRQVMTAVVRCGGFAEMTQTGGTTHGRVA